MRGDPAYDVLARVHQRIGLGVDIQTFFDGTVEVRWRRDYDGEWSDERWIKGTSLDGALWGVLAYEDEADRRDQDEEG